MAHKADSINIRIQDAVAWARTEQQRLIEETLNLPNGGGAWTSTIAHAVAFKVAAEVLEEVVAPGRHSTRPGWSMAEGHSHES